MQKKCSTCTHSIICRPKFVSRGPCADCEHLEKWEPMTNADAIRAMSDEELATFLAGWAERSLAWMGEYGETLGWLQEAKEEG